MNKVNLKQNLPIAYEGIVEAETQQDSLSLEIDKLNTRYEQALMDQFIQFASEKAIGYYENIFRIVADPENESLQFRRDRVLSRMKILTPPYTYYYLRAVLDGFFGVGKYTLDVNNDEYTITLESSAEDSMWYHEIQVSIVAVKPCNMIFINTPRVAYRLLTSEQIKSSAIIWNYKLDGTWLLGLKPFVTETTEEINKMPDVKSIQDIFITKNIQNWKDLINKSLLNNSVTITNLTKLEGDNDLTISYEVSSDTISSLTNIKLLDSANNILMNSNVFIPIDSYVIIKHIIKLEEGVNA